MMRHRRRSFGYLLLAVVAVASGCASSPRVEIARSPEADFPRYDTFSFHRPLGTDREEGTSTILSQTLKQAARVELESLGYRYVEGDADLAVNFFVETKEVVEGNRSPGISIGYGVFHRHYGVWTDYDPQVRQYTQGTLHVDVVDTQSNQLVWEGIARSQRPDGNFAFEPERAQAAVRRVFDGFPPSSRGSGS